MAALREPSMPVGGGTPKSPRGRVFSGSWHARCNGLRPRGDDEDRAGRVTMNELSRRIGFAKRVRVQTPFGAREKAWDLRPFGLGRVVAPELPTRVEIAQGTFLDLSSGEVRAARRSVAA